MNFDIFFPQDMCIFTVFQPLLLFSKAHKHHLTYDSWRWKHFLYLSVHLWPHTCSHIFSLLPSMYPSFTLVLSFGHKPPTPIYRWPFALRNVTLVSRFVKTCRKIWTIVRFLEFVFIASKTLADKTDRIRDWFIVWATRKPREEFLPLQ